MMIFDVICLSVNTNTVFTLWLLAQLHVDVFHHLIQILLIRFGKTLAITHFIVIQINKLIIILSPKM